MIESAAILRVLRLLSAAGHAEMAFTRQGDSMAVYLVTWDLNKQKHNYNQARLNLINHLARYEHIKDPGLDSVWFISSTTTANAISDDVRTKLDANDRLIVTKIVSDQHQGWLAKNVWDWINARL